MNWKFKLIDFTYDPAGVETEVTEPQGWENISLNIRRDEEMHGIFFEFTGNELTFYKEGMSILRDAYNGYGVEANVNIVVQASCDDDNYDTFYTGKLIFDTYKETISDLCSVSIRTEQQDVVTTFRNRIDTAVDLATTTSLDGTALTTYTNLPKNIYLPSKGLYKRTLRYMENDFYIAQGCVYRKNDISAGSGLETKDVTMYWDLDYENAQNDEVKNWQAVDMWDFSSGSMSTMIIEDDGQYDIDFRVKGIVLGGAQTEATILGGSPGSLENGFLDMWVDVIFAVNYVETIIGSYYLSTTTQNLSIAYQSPTTSSGFSMECHPTYGGGPTPTLNTFDENNPTIANIPIDESYTTTATLSNGDVVAVYLKVRQQGEYHRQLFNKEDIYWSQSFKKSSDSYFNINSILYKPTTNTDTFLVNESFARTTEAITDNKMSVYSDYFGRTDSQPYQALTDGCGSLESITTGLLIREQLVSGNTPKLNISFKDLFTGFNCIHNIGIGLEDDNYGGGREKIIRIEPVAHFYDSTTPIMTCGNVFNITRSVLPTRMYSEIEGGYAKYESEDITGIDEFLSKREYRTEWSQTRNKDSRVCNFIASGYALEVTRRKGHLTTSDWRLDNDIFVICMKRYSGDIVVEQGQISGDVNIVDPNTVYNFAISPIRNATRWLKTWFAGLKNPLTSKLIFANGTGNYFAGGQYTQACSTDGQVLIENDALESAMLTDPNIAVPLWKPEQIQFDYPMSMADYNTIKLSPYGYVKYSSDGITYQNGYILNIEYKPNQGIANFTLLSANF
jgi:hypothetical protein